MKKIILIIFMFLLLCGCGKTSNEDIVEKFKNKIEKTNSYILKGTMSISSNEETFTYNVVASKSKDNYYKISLINKTNDHEQVILKNADGVYVVTPDLNKSFKFQSDWPNNGSQSYLLDILVNDVKNDTELHIENNSDEKFIQCKVNYPNNSNLYSEKIYLDNDYGVEKVEVLDQDGKVKILLEIKSIDYKPKFDENYFALESYIKTESDENKTNEETNNSNEIKNNNESTNTEQNESNEETENTSNILEDIIYPLYVPENTHLSTEDTISTDNGNRAILTFAGEKPFIVVEEVSKKYDYLEVIPINGDPLMMSDSIGAISANSLYWSSDGIDYYISSTSLDGEELMTIAEGLTGTSIIVSSEK